MKMPDERWRYIRVNANLVRYETGRAYLLAMPRKSGFAGYAFWFPKSLCRSVGEWALDLDVPSGFQFRLEKKDKRGRMMGSRELSRDEVASLFEDLNPNGPGDESYLVVKEPKEIKIADVDVPEELMNDGK